MDVPAKGNILGGILPARYIVAILGMIGLVIIHGLKENLSFTYVSAKMMLNHTALDYNINEISQNDAGPKIFRLDEKCSNLSDYHLIYAYSNITLDGPIREFPGTNYMRAHNWGYSMALYFGARRAELRSAKWVMFFGVTLSIVTAFFTPLIVWTGMMGLGILRFMQGLASGAVYPAMHILLARWAPLTDRGTMTTLVNSGKSMGPIFADLLANKISTAIGWKSVFFISSVLSAIWVPLWVMLVEESPQRQRLIDIEERNMIVAALGNVIGDHPFAPLSFPWRLMFKSSAFWVILVTYLSFNVGYVSLVVWMPFYMADVLKYDWNMDLGMLVLMILSQVVFSIKLSLFLDWMLRKKLIKTLTARKISTALATGVPALCMAVFCFIGCNRGAALVMWVIAVVASGAIFSGLYTNVIDVAPRFAGTVLAICDVTSILFLVLHTIIFLLINMTGRNLFITTIVVYLIGFVVFSVGASSGEQQWIVPPKDDETELTPTQDNAETTNQATTHNTQL